MGIKSISLAAIAMVLTSIVNAELVSVDLNSVGDGLITHDTASELYWLDISETHNFSYDYVSSQLGSGGQFAGWRYASNSEVSELWSNFGLDLSGGDRYGRIPGLHPGLVEARSILGNASFDPVSYPYYMLAMTDAHNGQTGTSSGHYVAGAFYDSFNQTNVLPGTNGTWYDDYDGAASWLVRTSVVPIPGAAWLFGSGLIGLIGVARRKRA